MFRLLPILLFILAVPALARPRTPAAPPQSAKIFSQRTLDINAWKIYTTNYGPFVNPSAGPGGFWGGNYGYIYGAGIWFAATTPGGIRGVACGYNPSSGQSEMGPVNPYTESHEPWYPDLQARVYLSTNPIDVQEWPRKDPTGKPIIKSRQDSYCKYSDANPYYNFSGSAILNVVVEQITYAWNYADNNDIVFFFFNVKNKNNYTLTNCRIAPCVDADIGYEASMLANDRVTFDHARNLAIQFQSTPEPGWPRTGVVGFRFFQGPINNTGAPVYVVDNQYPRTILPGQPLGITAFKILTIYFNPETDEERYLTLEGVNYQTMIMDAYDEWESEWGSDLRFVQASGPFVLGPDSVVTLCVGAICAWDTVSLKLASDVAQEIFDNDFVLSSPPAAPRLSATPGDRRVYLSWDKTAETTPDPYHAKMDSAKSWHYYSPGSYRRIVRRDTIYMVDTLLVDSFRIRVGPSLVAIPRGAANPAGGSDTLEAFYSRKALFKPFDFQGYTLYRAASLSDLDDPAKRKPVGELHTGASGARRHGWDRADGVQIILSQETIPYHSPDTTIFLSKYDTIGTDRGLAYAYVDTELENYVGYWYGLSAHDYQPYAYFHRICPSVSWSQPSKNAVYVVPKPNPPNYVFPKVQVRVDGASDSRYGGALDYLSDLVIADPSAVPEDSFRLVWREPSRRLSGTYRLPVYSGLLFYSDGRLKDSIRLSPNYGIYPDYNYCLVNGRSDDQMLFGGLGFHPLFVFDSASVRIDSLVIVENSNGLRTYPRDSVSCRLDYRIFNINCCLWQWRGADFEIRWKDTVNASGRPALTAKVWDLTHNVEVPLEVGVNKADMIKSSWCFNPTSTIGGDLVDSSASSNAIGLHLAGISVYFNYARAVPRRMTSLWPHRPETGDVWRVFCSGSAPPIRGDAAVFITRPQQPGYRIGIAPDSVLYQNIPNPFSKSTAIVYQLTGKSPVPVSLHIYNNCGQRVRTLVDRPMPPGLHQAVWDGRTESGLRCPSGIYFYRIRIGDRTLTKRMVFLR